MTADLAGVWIWGGERIVQSRLRLGTKTLEFLVGIGLEELEARDERGSSVAPVGLRREDYWSHSA